MSDGNNCASALIQLPKRRLILFFMLFASLAFSLGAAAKASFAAGGSLTTDSDGYYLIEDAQDLAWIANNLGVNARLANDINLNSSPWTPIGSVEINYDSTISNPNDSQKYVVGTVTGYTGKFDGNGKTISGLTVSNATGHGAGLFGAIGAGGEVFDLTVIVDSVTGQYTIGAVAGYSEGSISRVKIEGKDTYGNAKIQGTGNFIGGAVGYNKGSVSRVSVSEIKVSSTVLYNEKYGYSVGGVIGENYGDIARVSVHNVDIHGNIYVGGIAGYSGTGSTITVSKVTMDSGKGYISWGRYHVGGIAGYNGGTISTVKNTMPVQFNTGTWLNRNAIGGIVGFNAHDGIVLNAINTGNIQHVERARDQGKRMGGIVGENYGLIQFTTNTGKVGMTNQPWRLHTGGIVGYNYDNGKVYTSINAGKIYGNVIFGGTQNTNVAYCAWLDVDAYVGSTLSDITNGTLKSFTQTQLNNNEVPVYSFFPNEFDIDIDATYNETATITFESVVGDLVGALDMTEVSPDLGLGSSDAVVSIIPRADNNASFVVTPASNGNGKITFKADLYSYDFDGANYNDDEYAEKSIEIEVEATVTGVAEDTSSDSGDDTSDAEDSDDSSLDEDSDDIVSSEEGDTTDDSSTGASTEEDTTPDDRDTDATTEEGAADNSSADVDMSSSESSNDDEVSSGCNAASAGVIFLLAIAPLALRRKK